MNNQTNTQSNTTANRQSNMQTNANSYGQYSGSEDQFPSSVAFILLAVAIGAVIALIMGLQQRRKPKTFREKLEYNLVKGSEATAHAVKQLSKDINELRKSVEDRLEQMR